MYTELLVAGLLPGELEALATAVLTQHRKKGALLGECVSFFRGVTSHIDAYHGTAAKWLRCGHLRQYL